MGLQTIGQLAAVPAEFLEARFGPGGRDLQDLARGRDDRAVEPGAGQVSTGKIGVGQVTPIEIRAGQTGALEIEVAEIEEAQVQTGEIRRLFAGRLN